MWESLVEDILMVEGYTEARIAKEIGVSQAVISRLRTGRTKKPQQKTASRLLLLYIKLEYSTPEDRFDS